MTDRFTVVWKDDVRVVDTTKKQHAIIHPGGPLSAIGRATEIAKRLNSKADTTTGYVWEKNDPVPTVGQATEGEQQ